MDTDTQPELAQTQLAMCAEQIAYLKHRLIHYAGLSSVLGPLVRDLADALEDKGFLSAAQRGLVERARRVKQ